MKREEPWNQLAYMCFFDAPHAYTRENPPGYLHGWKIDEVQEFQDLGSVI